MFSKRNIFYLFKNIRRWFFRTISLCLLFLLGFIIFSSLQIVLSGYIPIYFDIVYIEGKILDYCNEYRKEPQSILDMSEITDQQYSKKYMILPDDAPIRQLHPDIRIISTRPCAIINPFNYELNVIYTSVKGGDRYPNGYVDYHICQLSDTETRDFLDWVSQNKIFLNGLPQNQIYSFVNIELLLYVIIIIAFLLVFLLRLIFVIRKEKEYYNDLTTLFVNFKLFSEVNRRYPTSPYELKSYLKKEAVDYGLGTPIMFLRDLHIRYDNQLVILATRNAWLSPFFPFWGGKRILLLTEEGRIIKLRGILTIDMFFDKVKESSAVFKNRFEARLSQSFFTDNHKDEFISHNNVVDLNQLETIFKINKKSFIFKVLSVLFPFLIVFIYLVIFTLVVNNIFSFDVCRNIFENFLNTGNNHWFKYQIYTISLVVFSLFFNYYAEY